MAKRQPKNNGRPDHDPTDKDRQLVKAYVSFGLSRADTAFKVGISVPTLEKHYPDELKLGHSDMIAAVSQTAVSLALGSPAQYDHMNRLIREERKPDKEMVKYVLDRRGGKAWQPEPGRAGNFNGGGAAPKTETVTVIVKGGLMNAPDPD